MITIKSKREIELLRTAGEIVAKTHQVLKEYIKPGVSTHQLNNIAHDFIISQGAIPSFKDYNGFPGSICASINEVVVHGIPSKKQVLKEGDIIAIDIGACYKGYHGDSGWSYAVGTISDEDKKLLEVTEQSLYEGIKMVKPGNRISDISHAIESYIKPFGYGIVEDFTGHGIGRDLHEDPAIPNFGKPHEGPILKEGMVICIEPMVNIGTKRIRILKDNWTTITQDKKKSAHFEHQVAVTNDGYDILTVVSNKE
ncbi:type I methionyl aminopeptidase [Acholeplasma sp. OttesenSCG-928-E16]|nr:type I methionyl aminopeptidase [Acholeplasma sp. OttesenSCG-928-E16]